MAVVAVMVAVAVGGAAVGWFRLRKKKISGLWLFLVLLFISSFFGQGPNPKHCQNPHLWAREILSFQGEPCILFIHLFIHPFNQA